MFGLKDGRKDGWMDGWLDRWTDGRMDGWTDGLLYLDAMKNCLVMNEIDILMQERFPTKDVHHSVPRPIRPC